jgi:energy-coupling factor transport system substrate-specific component
MHIQAVTGDQLFRFSRAVFIIAVCVALNLIGVLISRELESILFLDLVGTAIASLIYGPIHGALVGFISNGIGEYLGFKYYFLFALVQAISAAAWGIIPRLSKGYLCTDFFNDRGDKAVIKYDYPRLFWGY